MGVSAKTLFHFTPRRKNLESILSNCFYPKYSVEDLSNVITSDIGYFAWIPMVSFCDLVFAQIRKHIEFYGGYGVGLDKNTWGLKSGISPVLYIPDGSATSELIKKFGSKEMVKILKENKVLIEHPDFFKYIKPYNGKIPPKNKNKNSSRDLVEVIYYDEREWRYVPNDFSVIPDEDYNQRKELKSQNQLLIDTRQLKFKAKDVKYIIVKHEKDIPYFFDYIENHLSDAQYNKEEKKLLISKLISVKQIDDDFA